MRVRSRVAPRILHLFKLVFYCTAGRSLQKGYVPETVTVTVTVTVRVIDIYEIPEADTRRIQ